ncbi:hypothetical protein PG1770B_0570 [Bifidobacterium pseudolongum subsp. globosum]|uniref:hypothetical protein n=1 Tax=Bifidobacterium pseudolongum TaxID=1694 RepID=UPI001021DDA4|nr:hypothetical protein [Bifidobacterium pseudolongum]RYQ50962.1 hypothetical protein PG1770B_0570 [Bifidobacterium pseudolongum subsp. globosum]
MMQKHAVGNKAVAALLAVGLAVSMGACGGNGAQGQPSGTGSASTAGESRVSKATAAFFDSKTEIPAEQAFGTKSVWFVKGSGVDIDDESTVDYIYVFDGKGSVTAYQTGYYPSTDNGAVTTTYGDLLGLSEDELIQLAKDRDKDCFDNARENYLSTSAKFFADKAEQDTSKAEEITKKGEEFQKTLSKTEYEEPAAKPFYLKANSSEEMLSFQISRFNEKSADRYLEGSGDVETFPTVNTDLDLEPIDTVQLDGMRLQGYSRIVTSVGPDNKGFTGMEQ